MVVGISKISYATIDAEHYAIIQQLKALGITPTGNKDADRAKLNIEKNKLIQQIKTKAKNKNDNKPNFKEILGETISNNNPTNQLELEMLGAKSVGELNRIYFNI